MGKIYYKAGFYRDDIHGAKKLTVQDPDWVRPMVDVRLEPGESVTANGAEHRNETEGTITVSVPDFSLHPPMVDIPNLASSIPHDAVEITEERHIELMTEQGLGAKIQPDANGFPVAVYPAPLTAPQLIDRAKKRARGEGAKRLLALARPYRPEERETWADQQAEAKAYLADAAAETPLLDALAAGRGISKAELAVKIMENVSAFKSASGTILGKQQAALDALAALPETATREEIDALVSGAFV